MATDAPRTLLVLKPSSFGDIVHTLPAVSRLKAAWPECRISWLANTEWMPLLADNPDIDEVIEFPRRNFRGWGGGLAMVRWMRTVIRGRRPDMALDFQGLLRTALIGRASGARIFAGLSDAREGARWFYHRTVISPKQPVHAVERYLALANTTLSEGGKNMVDKRVEFALPAGEIPDAPCKINEPFILLHPYARGKGKSLRLKDISAFIRRINNKKIVIVGRGVEPNIQPDIGHSSLMNRTSLAQLIWLVRRASFVVSVDSGPAHLAAALGRPMVAIHAWSDPRQVGPYRPDAWVWKNGALMQVCNLASMSENFFEPAPLHLRDADLEAIAALATSP